MATKLLPVLLAAGLLLGGFRASVPAQTPSIATGQRITIIGTLRRIDGRTNPVVFAGDDRHLYTLDISKARITEPNGSLARLVPGMRAYVSGRLSAGEGILVSRLQILPAVGVQPPAALPEVTNTAEPPDLTVRGKVEALDLEHGSFVLRISTHTRTVYVTADTDVSGLGPLPSDQFPIKPGKRVTVGGSLQPDGTVLAGLLTLVRDVDYQTPASRPNRVLIGDVSSPANKLGRRDIKVRTADGTETRIQIPRGIPIRRGGRQISVYDLSSRDAVRVLGRIIGTDFHASRIEVLAPSPEPAPDDTPPAPTPAPPSRPGL